MKENLIPDGVSLDAPMVHSPAPTPAEFQAELIAELAKRHAKGDRIDGREVVSLLDPDADNRQVREWLAQNRVMKGAEFDRALKQERRRQKIESRLGFVPETVVAFVKGYAERERIGMTYRGLLKRSKPVTYGKLVDDEVLASTVINEEDRIDPRIDNHVRLTAGSRTQISDFLRELRLLSLDLGLGYSDNNILDAVQEWTLGQREEHKLAIFDRIASYNPGPTAQERAQASWDALERAAFDVSETCPGFAVAVLRKFIWQVKRKMLGLRVTNHLMPVLTGAQGKGKSTLVRNLLLPVEECTANSDFKQITDDRNIQLWENYAIFLDELGHAKRAEMDEVKNIITANVLTRRPMRTNDVEHVEQRATFIGCTNKGLSELIRDETGVRRFAELAFTNTPDWEAINALDWEQMWRSVDERGPDPSSLIATTLADQQSENRTLSAVEQWARQEEVGGKQRADDLHSLFRVWEQNNFPRNATDITSWGKEMKRLMRNDTDFPWSAGRDGRGVWYCKGLAV